MVLSLTMTTQQAAGPMLLLFVLLAATTAVAGTSPSSSSSFSAGAIAVQYTVSNDTIGPVDQQYNGTHKIVDCTSPGECISAASSICSVNFTSWCHAFAIEDLWGTARDDPFSLATNGDHSQQQQRQVALTALVSIAAVLKGGFVCRTKKNVLWSRGLDRCCLRWVGLASCCSVLNMHTRNSALFGMHGRMHSFLLLLARPHRFRY